MNKKEIEFKNLESMQNEQDIFNTHEAVLKYSFLALFIFCSAFLFTDIYYIYKSPNIIKEVPHRNNMGIIYKQPDNTMLHSSVNSHNDYYVLFKNTEPTIKEIELFIANNQYKLSKEELDAIEELRNRRITEIMARKYVYMTQKINN